MRWWTAVRRSPAVRLAPACRRRRRCRSGSALPRVPPSWTAPRPRRPGRSRRSYRWRSSSARSRPSGRRWTRAIPTTRAPMSRPRSRCRRSSARRPSCPPRRRGARAGARTPSPRLCSPGTVRLLRRRARCGPPTPRPTPPPSRPPRPSQPRPAPPRGLSWRPRLRPRHPRARRPRSPRRRCRCRRDPRRRPRSGPDRSGPDRSGPDRSGPDRSGPDLGGPDLGGPGERGRRAPAGLRTAGRARGAVGPASLDRVVGIGGQRGSCPVAVLDAAGSARDRQCRPAGGPRRAPLAAPQARGASRSASSARGLAAGGPGGAPRVDRLDPARRPLQLHPAAVGEPASAYPDRYTRPRQRRPRGLAARPDLTAPPSGISRGYHRQWAPAAHGRDVGLRLPCRVGGLLRHADDTRKTW
jgi:hypothetical protein